RSGRSLDAGLAICWDNSCGWGRHGGPTHRPQNILGPRKPGKTKSETYECGIETVGDTWVQLKGQYYIFGLIFLIFDIEAVFLFPWAVAYDRLQFYMVLEGVLFILILAGGLVYAWRKGALEWV
ncbi:MAG: NADH-quinone oxidoreductase subunit A, partial [Anaerolineales bacterium]